MARELQSVIPPAVFLRVASVARRRRAAASQCSQEHRSPPSERLKWNFRRRRAAIGSPLPRAWIVPSAAAHSVKQA
jgi:hypothetical protein